ncbi:alpha/beta fold hydrolase [Pseudocolwellia sp. HL-MZ19]|uniref:alpha/beta fold hydrolase n=1 Tax=unclassified Pseudocolwellia TaxID=2848178 RepID=UPI003CED0886
MGNNVHNEQDIFWEQGVFNAFKGKDDLDIHYAHFKHSPTSPIIVISPGRCESYLKYKETAFELYQSGYSIFIVDHRGQGLSSRMLANKYKGYVKKFDDYADDLYQFVTTIVAPYSGNTLPYLLAHSMGCAITLRMLQLYPKVIKKAVLLSPMIAINTGPLPYLLAINIIRFTDKLNQILSKESWYFAGQSNFKVKPFKNNPLTHCEKRYHAFADLYQDNHAIQLGGVTVKWLYEAFKTEHLIFSNLNKISTPICLLQASDDIVIDNKKQNNFCRQLNALSPELITPKPVVIEGAYHELLFEKDSIRDETLTQIRQFFSVASTTSG